MRDDEILKLALDTCEEFSISAGKTVTFDIESLLSFARKVIQESKNQWMPIETAPKDGTWIRLWREPEEYLIASPEIIARWVDFGEDGGAWVWPDDNYDPYTERGKSLAIDSINAGDYFYDESFTHWMPLPDFEME